MRITGEVLQKIEDKLWENLEELNKDEKKWIEHRNSSHYSMCHFSDSYRYISCINLLQGLKEVVDDDKNYIKHYGLEEFETEEDKKPVENGVTLNYKEVSLFDDGRVSLLFDDIIPLILSQDDLLELIADLKLSGAISFDDLFDELLEKHEEITM